MKLLKNKYLKFKMMKNFLKITIIAILLISTACSNDNVQNENDISNVKISNAEKIDQFEKSVAISFVTNNITEKSNSSIVKLKLTDYSSLGVLYPVYKFNGYEFGDTGKNNDEVAEDGIYTSAELINVTNEKSNSSQLIFVSDNFIHRDKLPQSKVFDCAISAVECPNTSWYDNDWGTGWGCFEFSDCRVGF